MIKNKQKQQPSLLVLLLSGHFITAMKISLLSDTLRILDKEYGPCTSATVSFRSALSLRPLLHLCKCCVHGTTDSLLSNSVLTVSPPLLPILSSLIHSLVPSHFLDYIFLHSNFSMPSSVHFLGAFRSIRNVLFCSLRDLVILLTSWSSGSGDPSLPLEPFGFPGPHEFTFSV